jgi:hypothetical protein
MRIWKLVALLATLVGGLAAFGASPSQAAPMSPGSAAVVRGEAGVQAVQYYYRRPRVYVRGPVYRVRPAYRPIYRRPVYGYRPIRRSRVVCGTRFRVVPTAYGYVRRPVRVCNRVF